ncbi:MAG: cyclic nucleotide-binding/CBS domain-containing protein [Gammaproteobacteria bacterium]|nr:MAG: cyclic nucleotide-binding/CBS domain-containing protein [Gammaproteobacteria bacterium]
MTVSVEVAAVRDFLSECTPFNELSEEHLTLAASHVQIAYYRSGESTGIFDYSNPRLLIVRSGAFEVRNTEGELLDRVEPGGYFGYPSLLTGDAITNQAVVIEDGLLYQIDADTFQLLRSVNRSFDRFFNQAHAKRLRHAVRFREQNYQLTRRVGDLSSRQPVTAAPDQTVAEVAALMTVERVSSVMVVDEDQQLCGLVTDRDLRARVVAAKRGPETLLSEIMTLELISVSAESLVFEALLLMTEHNIHHLPVITDGKPMAMLTTTDLVKAQKADPVFLIGEIGHQDSVEGLKGVSRDIPELLRSLIRAEASADQIGRLLTTVTDALTRQLIKQAIDKFGEPPVPFAWLAFGSQGRRDQTAISDQDNGMLIGDAVTQGDDEYFLALANYVNDGLDACGYKYCPGEIMASTPEWRQPLVGWKKQFLRWINQPSSKALMHASIFFDMRCVYGDESLFNDLQTTVCDAARGNEIFLANLTANALKLTPPMGFFKNFVVEHSGEHKNTLDVKLRGIMPINDIARIYALSVGSKQVHTLERLQEAASSKLLTLKDSRNLTDAHEFISRLRLVHQGEQLREGIKPDNHLNPSTFSSLSRHQLRDAFAVVTNAQSALRVKFTHGLM